MSVRTPEDIASGTIRVSVGGVERIVPTLPIGPTRDWQTLVADRLGAFGVILAAEQSPSTLAELSHQSLDTVLDLAVAYDRTGSLGGRAWLEEHADPEQVYAAVRLMLEVAFPFAPDLRTLLTVLPGVILRGPSGPANSTSSPSPSGDSILEP